MKGSFDQAIEGCVGVFHTASPFYPASDKGDGIDIVGWNELVIPAYVGTKTVLEACQRTNTVKRVIVTGDNTKKERDRLCSDVCSYLYNTVFSLIYIIYDLYI